MLSFIFVGVSEKLVVTALLRNLKHPFEHIRTSLALQNGAESRKFWGILPQGHNVWHVPDIVALWRCLACIAHRIGVIEQILGGVAERTWLGRENFCLLLGFRFWCVSGRFSVYSAPILGDHGDMVLP